jgi:glycerophosphoryl diester phosphodiesterase
MALIIAHRGASAVAPESTRAAIVAAVRAGARMIELDVQLTKDRRLVIIHDGRLERTTNGRGRVRAWRYAQLARLDAGSWFHPRFAGERLLTASQALQAVPRPVGINFELKRTWARRALVARVRRLLGRVSGRRLLVSSFDPALLRPLRGSGAPLALICRIRPDGSLRRAIRLGCAAWHPFHSLVTRRRVARAHEAGLRVHAWTVDQPALARRLLRLGVDGIFTNDPARLAALGSR